MSSVTYDHHLLTRQREWIIYPTGYGHYACGSPDSEELCNGQAVDVLLGSVWIPGFIKLGRSGDDVFVAMADHTVCGLCGGMKIRAN